MSIDLTKTLEVLQRKINSFDSTGDEYDLKYLLKAALRGERSTVYHYNTEDDLPNLLDDSAGGFDNEMLVYAKDSKQFYFHDFQNKLWKSVDLNVSPWTGSNAGFIYGSNPSPGPTGSISAVQSYPFVTPFTQSSQVGNLTIARNSQAGVRNYIGEESYVAGGTNNVPTVDYDTIEKHPNTTGSIPVVDVGSLSTPAYWNTGSSSYTHGFVHKGGSAPGQQPTDKIDKFQFASSVSSSEVGSVGITVLYSITDSINQKAVFRTISQYVPSSNYVIIPFSSNTPFTGPSIGVFVPAPITTGRGGATASDTDSYISGWYPSVSFEKFSFANNTISVIPGNTIGAVGNPGGSASSSAGYFAGNHTPTFPFTVANEVTSFPFATNTIVKIGDLNPSNTPYDYSANGHF